MRLKEATISANTGLDAVKRAPIVDYDTGLKCIRIQDISHDTGYEDWGNTETTDSDYRKFKLMIDDLLVARTGATVGVSFIVKEDYNAVFNNGSIRLRFNDKVNPRFISYVFKTNSFRKYIDNVSCVATQPNLRVENLLRFTIPDYELKKQGEIVHFLECYDNAIDNNNKRIKILEQMAENLYKEWFVRFRFHGYEDVEWVEDRADELFDITIGKTPSRQDFDAFVSGEENAIDWVSISDMKSMYIGNTNEQLTIDAVKNYKVVRVPKKTILLSFKLTVGRVAITTKESCTNEAIAHFKNVDEEYIEYLYLYLKLFDYNTLGNTSAIGNAINSKIVKAMKIKVPDKDTAIRFHDVAGKIFDEILVLNQKNMNLTKQRDLLLPRLMSGKLKLK